LDSVKRIDLASWIGSEATRFSVLTLNLWNVNEPLAARMSALAARSLSAANSDPTIAPSSSTVTMDSAWHPIISVCFAASVMQA
jgi:hypothetical protein